MNNFDDLVDQLAFGKSSQKVGPCLGFYLSPEVIYISETHLEKGRIVVDHLVRIPVPPPEKAPPTGATPVTGTLNTDFLNDNTKLIALITQSMSSIKWGSVNGRLGAGWRHPVAPFKTDNDLRVQLFYQLGYLYSSRLSDTGANVVLPPNTLVHGPLVRVRYDAMHRNLMELPHSGPAAGLDALYFTRANWSDANYGGSPLGKADTQSFSRLSGYLMLATGVPFMSERNRLLFSVHGGFAPYGTLDRFSTFRIGGGPVPSEADDLERQVFPGAMFTQFPVSDYLIGAVEYRREIFSFLYLHLRGTYARVNREEFDADHVGNFVRESGQAVTTGFTSGFFLKSELHLDYTYDSSILRSGSRGSNIILLWSKSF